MIRNLFLFLFFSSSIFYEAFLRVLATLAAGVAIAVIGFSTVSAISAEVEIEVMWDGWDAVGELVISATEALDAYTEGLE